jgi:cell pole-organizing protein PopZ
MSDSSSEKEPTMEEILASIRKIISEDEPRDGEGEEAAAAAEEDDEAPLDLTQMVEEDGTVVDLGTQRDAAPEPVSETPPEPAVEAEADASPEPEDAGDEVEFELEAVETEPPAETAPAAPSPPAPTPSAEGLEGLVADATASSATSAMSLLTEVLDSNGKGESGASGADITLVALVRETLKPHLKAWLDENLPGLVERIVREEIKKMVKRAEYR